MNNIVRTINIFEDVVKAKINILELKKSLRIKTKKLESNIELNVFLYDEISKGNCKDTGKMQILAHSVNLLNNNDCEIYQPSCDELVKRALFCKNCESIYLNEQEKTYCISCNSKIQKFYKNESQKSRCSVCTMKIILLLHKELCYYLEDKRIQVDKSFLTFVITLIEHKFEEIEVYEIYSGINEK